MGSSGAGGRGRWLRVATAVVLAALAFRPNPAGARSRGQGTLFGQPLQPEPPQQRQPQQQPAQPPSGIQPLPQPPPA